MANKVISDAFLRAKINKDYFVVGESLNRFKILGFLLGISGVAIVLGPSIVGTHNNLPVVY